MKPVSAILVHSLYMFPVKSCRGMSLNEAFVEARGFKNDRRWVITDRRNNNRFLSQRTHGQMAQIETSFNNEGRLVLRHAGRELIVPQTGSETVQVEMWQEQLSQAFDLGDEAAAWLRPIFSEETIEPRLCYQDETHERSVDPVYSNPGDIVSFADAFPILIANQSSLDHLNARLAEPVPMLRFRPNIVIEGLDAFAEDRVESLRIGDMIFDLVKGCARCKVVTLDPQTGEAGPKDNNPLKELGEYRRGINPNKIYFGINVIPRNTGTIKVGDPIEILKTGDTAHHMRAIAA